jgi:hypothetical protein
MDTTIVTDFVVSFNSDTEKHVCQQTTRSLDHSPLPVRLLFPDRAAFLQHRDSYGRIRVAFADAERIVYGAIEQSDEIQHAVGESETHEECAKDDAIILTRPILYNDPLDVIRDIKARWKRG